MDAREFLGLEPTHNPMRWVLPVVPGLSTGSGFLFGGCGLGAAIAAMEGTTGRPVIWATAQYLSYARHPSMMDIDVVVAVGGHQVTQARAVAHVGDAEILTVNAALGTRPLEVRGQWAVRPDVRPPAECQRRALRHDDNTLRVAKLVPTEWVLLDIRVHAIANGFGHGVVHLWAEDGTLLATASQSCIVRFWKE